VIPLSIEKSKFAILDFNENPNLGVYCRTNENVTFLRKGLSKKVKKKIKNALDVELLELNIADATILGSLLTFNSRGVVVTDFIDVDSINIIKNQGFDVCVISDRYNAAGNDILVNDNGVLVHPDMCDESLKLIEDVFRTPVYRGTIAGLKTVGMAAVVTNKGLLCHPKATEEEIRNLEKIFCVDVMIGTVNHGVPLIGSGLVANSKGAIVGNLTTGIELGRIEEALGFLD
jgi:translation initiation factor 6